LDFRLNFAFDGEQQLKSGNSNKMAGPKENDQPTQIPKKASIVNKFVSTTD
jgi:hypothetical protein